MHLATGHSARDIYELLHSKNIQLSSKPFALGVRIEHTQDFMVSTIRKANDEFLPPASYKLSTQIDDKGVYSFVCVQGDHSPCATIQKELSPMDGRQANVTIYSNSGIVVSISPQDISDEILHSPVLISRRI